MGERNQKGFTLIEVVVVVAVIAILAAVLTPYITKYIDDSKIAKARNETQVIGGALTNFYKDVGLWPNRNAAGVVGVLPYYTGTTTPTAAAIFTGAPAVVPPVVAWAGSATAVPLDNSLVTNSGYPATGDLSWKGPYAGSALPADPWGRPYMVNVAATGPIWVLCAGPNGKVQTAVTATVVNGDDIGFRVR
jgi:prepilin-type N-terminal cleavage/methylation domain-containing protein